MTIDEARAYIRQLADESSALEDVISHLGGFQDARIDVDGAVTAVIEGVGLRDLTDAETIHIAGELQKIA